MSNAVENENQSIAKESIIFNQVHNLWTTITDWIANILSCNSLKYAIINKNQILSDSLTSMFNNTTINVYVYDSKVANCFTLIGMNLTATPLAYRLSNEDKVGSLIKVVSNFEKMVQLIQSKFSNSGNILTLKFDPNTKKYNLNIETCTIYISTGFVNLLDNDNEIKAVLLSEIGENIQITVECSKMILSAINKYSLIGAFLSAVILAPAMYLNAVNDNNDHIYTSFEKSMISIIGSLLLLSMLSIFISMYLSRRRREYSDIFASKVGYSDYLKNALKKLHNYQFDSSINTNLISNLNFFDRILHFINKCCAYVTTFFARLGFSNILTLRKRIELIDKNDEKYAVNDDNSNIQQEEEVRMLYPYNKLQLLKESRDELNKINYSIQWSNVKPLRTPQVLKAIEDNFKVRIPNELKIIISKYNGAIPNKMKYYNANDNIYYYFTTLISFNKNDSNSFHSILKYFKANDNTLTLMPFGIDDKGSYFCIDKKGNVVLYDKDDIKNEPKIIAPTFIAFMNKLTM